MPKISLPTLADYERLIDRFIEARGPERDEISAEIERRFAVEGAVLVLDIAGFSRLTARHGVIHYLAMVRRMQLLAIQMINEREGEILKFEADNLFAFFSDVDEALQFATDMRAGLTGMNVLTDDELDIFASIGIAAGSVLVIEKRDAWGEAMNLASRLGEDIADADEILVCAKSFETADNKERYRTEPAQFTDRGVTIEAVRIVGVAV